MSKECQNPNTKLKATAPGRPIRFWGIWVSFVIRISRMSFPRESAPRTVSHSPATSRASKTVLAHAELHLARAHSAGGAHRRLRPHAQGSRRRRGERSGVGGHAVVRFDRCDGRVA